MKISKIYSLIYIIIDTTTFLLLNIIAEKMLLWLLLVGFGFDQPPEVAGTERSQREKCGH